jgi:tRNA 2-thiouridine synthesizing protein B
VLHIITYPIQNNDFNGLEVSFSQGDDILLSQDGVLSALDSSDILTSLLSLTTNLWVIKEDVIARGLLEKISPKVFLVNYTGFVSLTVKHSVSISWQ